MSSSNVPPAGNGDAEDLRVTVEARDHAVVLAAAGELDMLTAGGLRRAIVAVLDSRPRVLVIDLSKLEFLASAGLNVLLEANEVAGSATRVRVVATSEVTRRPLRITGLTEYLAVFDSLDAALAES